MTDPTPSPEAAADPEVNRGPSSRADRSAENFAVVDPASFVEVAPAEELEAPSGDPLAKIRRATGGTVTDRARRAPADAVVEAPSE